MAKRGRKRKKKLYIGPKEEKAIVEYLNEPDPQIRNIIYETELKHAFSKLVENIINTYQLYSLELSYEELHCDTLAFLHQKMHKFNPDKGKAYSYYGTIVKRRLINKRKKEATQRNRVLNFQDAYEYFQDNEAFSYEEEIEIIEGESNIMKQAFYDMIMIIKEVLKTDELSEHTLLKDNERIIGFAVVEVMDNWEKIFEEYDNKYTKNVLLECLRNMTGMKTKEIRNALARFKTMYYSHKKDLIDRSYL